MIKEEQDRSLGAKGGPADSTERGGGGDDRGCCWPGMFRTMDLPALLIFTGMLSGAASSESQ